MDSDLPRELPQDEGRDSSSRDRNCIQKVNLIWPYFSLRSFFFLRSTLLELGVGGLWGRPSLFIFHYSHPEGKSYKYLNWLLLLIFCGWYETQNFEPYCLCDTFNLHTFHEMLGDGKNTRWPKGECWVYSIIFHLSYSIPCLKCPWFAPKYINAQSIFFNICKPLSLNIHHHHHHFFLMVISLSCFKFLGSSYFYCADCHHSSLVRLGFCNWIFYRQTPDWFSMNRILQHFVAFYISLSFLFLWAMEPLREPGASSLTLHPKQYNSSLKISNNSYHSIKWHYVLADQVCAMYTKWIPPSITHYMWEFTDKKSWCLRNVAAS